MMGEELYAIANGRWMGTLVGGGNSYTFRYHQQWQEDPRAFPLSLSMPLSLGEHSHKVIEAFLWGLLPDNEAILKRWGTKFQVSARNAFALIRHVGEDCAGAVQFVPEEKAVALLQESAGGQVKWLKKGELDERIAALLANHSATRTSSDPGQFSLAGAQPKLALYYDKAKKRWGVPQGRTPTTHILKPSVGEYDGFAENEHFCLRLAEELELRVPPSQVVHAGGVPVIITQRYDRMKREDGFYVRIHQEDFCQALAVPPHLKYEKDQGPSAGSVAGVLWDASSNARDDVRMFAKALIFHWLTAGTDAHAKNYSLLIADRSQVRLAPLYDLISSLPYPQQIQAEKARLAMKIGSEYKVRNIGKQHWESCAKALGLPAKEVFGLIEEMAARLPDAAERVAEAMEKDKIRHPVIGQLVIALKAHVAYCLENLASATPWKKGRKA